MPATADAVSPGTDSQLQCGQRKLDLHRARIMGILNLTPDSFSDGGRFFSGGQTRVDAAVRAAEAMVVAGADIIDVGGESTRPGAGSVTPLQEMDRVLEVVQMLCGRVDAVISVDTSTPMLMREAASAGAGMLNDVRAFSRLQALQTAAATGCSLCLVHMQGNPGTMQRAPSYGNVVAEVVAALLERLEQVGAAGVASERLVLDPGFGFGKTLAHNLRLLHELPELVACGVPLMVGVSRKSMLGQVANRGVQQRLAPGLAAAVMAVERGARIIRTHDVEETAAALALVAAVADWESVPISG